MLTPIVTEKKTTTQLPSASCLHSKLTAVHMRTSYTLYYIVLSTYTQACQLGHLPNPIISQLFALLWSFTQPDNSLYCLSYNASPYLQPILGGGRQKHPRHTSMAAKRNICWEIRDSKSLWSKQLLNKTGQKFLTCPLELSRRFEMLCIQEKNVSWNGVVHFLNLFAQLYQTLGW